MSFKNNREVDRGNSLQVTLSDDASQLFSKGRLKRMFGEEIKLYFFMYKMKAKIKLELL